MIRFPISRAHKHKVIQKTKTEILKAAAPKNQSKMDLMPLPPKQETKSSENQLQLTKTKTQKNSYSTYCLAPSGPSHVPWAGQPWVSTPEHQSLSSKEPGEAAHFPALVT